MLLLFHGENIQQLQTAPVLFIVNIMVGCNNNESISNNPSTEPEPTAESRLPEPDILQRLTIQKHLIDTMFYSAIYTSDPFGLTAEGNVIKITEEVEESGMFSKTYLVVKDKHGAITRISESPYSESGDWSVSVAHYFDKNSKTFAIEKTYGTLHSLCSDEVVSEQKTVFYSDDMKLLNKVRVVTGDGNKPVADSCIPDFYDDYAVFPNLAACLKQFGIDTVGRKL